MDVKVGKGGRESVLLVDRCSIYEQDRERARRISIKERHNVKEVVFFTGVTVGGIPACYIIEHHLSRFVEGQVSMN